jgi:hypothetical protein
MLRHRLCTSPHHRGPRWCSWINFHVKKWGDIQRTWPAQLQSQCKACQRISLRILQAQRRGKPRSYRPRHARNPRTHSERMAQKAIYYRMKMAEDSEWAENRRKNQREASRMRRAAEGVRIKGPWRKYRKVEEARMLDPQLLVKALEEMPTTAIASLPASMKRRIYEAREGRLISHAHVDRIFTECGRPELTSIVYGDEE